MLYFQVKHDAGEYQRNAVGHNDRPAANQQTVNQPAQYAQAEHAVHRE